VGCAGDKEANFVGSREWIGAIELGYVLDTHMGVTSKIITVASGADMPSKAREIARHFDTQVRSCDAPFALS
jgi:Ufm1-specific protease 2